MRYITVTTDVDIDVDDVLSELSYSQRKDLYENLKEEFAEDSPEDSFTGSSYTEQELGDALNQIWQDRFMLTKSQRERIIAITKESFIEQ
jgi:hypothetical protein